MADEKIPINVDLDTQWPVATAVGQGVTAGYGDEMTARLESILTGVPYREVWERKQAELKALYEAYPGRMLAGEVTGAVLPTAAAAFIPGMQAPGAMAGARLAALSPRIAALAASMGPKTVNSLIGAIQGYGQSSKTGLASAADAGQGALEGLLGGQAGKYLSKGASKAYDKMKGPLSSTGNWILKKTAKPLFGVPPEIADDILANKALYKDPTIEPVSSIVDNTVVPMINQVSRGFDVAKSKAKSMLDSSKVVTKVDDVMDFMKTRMLDSDAIVDKQVKKNGVITTKLQNNAAGPAVENLRTHKDFLEKLTRERRTY